MKQSKNKKILIISYDDFCLNYSMLIAKLQAYFSLNNMVFDFVYYQEDKNNEFIINNIDSYDYFFINSCIVTFEGINLCNSIIKRLKEKSRVESLSNIVLLGCGNILNNVDTDGITKIKIGFENKIDNIFPLNKVKFNDIKGKIIDNFLNTRKNRFDGTQKNRFFVGISRGCVHNCSYCKTKEAVGYVKSVAIKDIINEIKEQIKHSKFEELVLVSDDFSSYGLDIGESFVSLLKEIVKIGGDFKINIDYIQPSLFIKHFEQIEDIIPRISYMCLSVQHFDDRILKLMNRKYSAQQCVDLVKRIKEINPNVFIMTQIIYGYPSETREEFLKNFNNLGLFDKVDFYIFSNVRNLDSHNFVEKKELLYRKLLLYKEYKANKNIGVVEFKN